MPSHPLPLVVACGAYERDNIGDLLFLVVSEHFARGVVEADFTAPIAADMTALLGRPIPSTGRMVSDRDYDGIWTVGGEVGATLREYVYRTAVDDAEWDRFTSLDAIAQDAVLDEVMQARLESPYVPRPSALPRNRGARLVLNSVGVSGIAGLPPWRAAVATGALREASFISVRDQKSSDLLKKLDIPHRLAPDLIHTIAAVIPVDEPRGDTVLLHLSEGHIRAHGLSAWADAITATTELRDHPVRLFVAGSAPAHDSIALYHELVSAVREQRPDWDIALSDGRSVEERVREIATAALWIGSSLHGRIIASAYGTKRISIAKPKVDVYAQTWDPDFPLAVDPSTLPSAVTSALALEHDSAHIATLAEHARRSVIDALGVLTGQVGADAADSLTVRVREAEELQVAAMTLERAHADTVQTSRERAAEAARLARDRDEQRSARRALDEEVGTLRARLTDIETSTSWKVGSRLAAVAGVIRHPRALGRFLRRRPDRSDEA